MAELVDALVSEASEETHGGSSPLGHTKFRIWHFVHKMSLFVSFLKFDSSNLRQTFNSKN